MLSESLDIVKFVDTHYGNPVLVGPSNPQIEQWVNAASTTIFKLAIPRWPLAPLDEFGTASARAYFIRNKEQMIGTLTEHLENSKALIAQAQNDLHSLEEILVSGKACNGELSVDDVLLFPMLRALSIVNGI